MSTDGFLPASTLSTGKSRPLLVPRCNICLLWKKCQSPKMPVWGEGKKGILLVGQAPAKQEDRENRPFIGDAEQHLRKALAKVDIDADKDCWITNSIICRSHDDEDKNRAPTKDEIDYCRPNLTNTIKRLQPTTIILLGTEAVMSLIGSLWKEDVKGVTRWVGWQIPCQSINAYICPTYHPSYCQRELNAKNPVVDLLFNKHLAAAVQLKGRPWKEAPNYASKVVKFFDHEQAAKAIRAMVKNAESKEIPLAFDFETNMLKPYRKEARIICCSVSDGVSSLSYPWHGEAVIATKEMGQSSVPKIAANLKMEETWYRQTFGIGVRNWWADTVVDAHVLDNRDDITSLKFQLFVTLGQESYDDAIKPYLKAVDSIGRNKINEVDLSQILLYCGIDSIGEWWLAKKQSKKIGREF